MSKAKPTAGAARPVAPAAEAPRQSVATAAEAGLPRTLPDAAPDAAIRALLRANGLKKAAVDHSGNVHFDEAFIETLDASTLTLIQA